MQRMKFFLILVLAMSSLAHAAFVPPSEGPVPFRRDKLPVDVDTMVSLSKQLVVLAGATDVNDPAEARRAAQILGLSLALDPTNRNSLEVGKRLKRGKNLDTSDSNEINQATSRAWHLMGWLEQPEAGADGNALAACLADILEGVDPGHPRAVELAGKSEQGKWDGWVASVDAFKDTTEPVMATNDVTPEVPTISDPVVAIKLNTASVEIPLWYTHKVSKKLVFAPVSVKMNVRTGGGDENLKIKIENSGKESLDDKTVKSLKAFLEKRHGTLPKGLQYNFQIANGIPYSEARNGNVILGAVLVLADSSLSGKPPTGMVFAEPDADGGLKLPSKFWQSMRVLADQESGSRLVLPSVAQNFMPPLITLDKANFFINFEVLMANDAAGLCDLASSMPPQRVSEAHTAFDMIRNARGTRSLGGFLSHDSTQQRLKQVSSSLPDHVSARMLALRGTSQWPKRLPREIFAREIRAAIEPLGSSFKPAGWMTIDAEVVEAKVDESREQLAVVEKLFGSVGDRQELHAPALNVAKLLSSLAADSKRSNDIYFERMKHEAAFREAWAEYVRVIQLLTFAAGDSEDYPVPAMQPAK